MFKDDFEEINNTLTRDLDFETLDISEEELMKELEDCINEKEDLSAKTERSEPEQVELVVFPEVPVNENKKDVWQRKFIEKVRTMGV